MMLSIFKYQQKQVKIFNSFLMRSLIKLEKNWKKKINFPLLMINNKMLNNKEKDKRSLIKIKKKSQQEDKKLC